jgi:hypothetical protein
MASQPTAHFAEPMSFAADSVARAAERIAADATPQAHARLVRVEAGLHVLTIGPIGTGSDDAADVALPAIQVASPPSNRFDPVDIITEWGDPGAWLGTDGGTVVLRSPPGGGYVLVTTYAPPGALAALPCDIALRPIGRAGGTETRDAHRANGASRVPPSGAPVDDDVTAPEELEAVDPGEIETDVTLHIERQGDRRFPGRGWVGNRGRRLRVEAFSIVPRGTLSGADIEYKAFGPGGRETRWVSDAKLCGTKGRGLPLTGFAVRLAPHLRGRFDVIYQGAFFDSGATEPCRNGEACVAAHNDDVLEALNVRVVERAAR